MPNEITIKIKVENDSAKGFDETLAAAKEFGAKLKEELDRAGKDAGQKAADEIKHQLEELDPPAIDVKVDTEEAKIEIDEVKEDLDRLGRDDVKVNVKIDSVKALGEATVLKEEIGKKLGGKSSGGGIGQSIVDGLKNFDFKPGLGTVGGSIIAAFAPLIGAGIAGLVVGGLGLGGIVGGVLVASRDARVQSAFTSLKKDLGDSLKIDAAPFVPVVEAGIGSIRTAFHSFDLAGIFKDLAPQVEPVLNGILDLVSSLGESIRNVAAHSGPVMKELGTDFRNLGNTLEAAFNSLTDNSKGEAEALHDLFAVIDGSITTVFDLVNALTEVYGVFHKIFADTTLFGFYELMQDHSQAVTGAIHEQVGAVVDAVNSNYDLAHSSKAAADAAALQAKAVTDTADALKAATDPAFALIDAQKQVNDAQTAYNKAVKTGGQNSTAAKNAQVDLEKAMVNYVSAASKAGTGTGHLTDEQKALLRAAGASNGTIKALDTSLQNAYKAAHKLDNFNIDITVTEHFKQTGKYISPSQFANPTQLYSGLASGGIKGAASGATSSGLTWVGENGPELMSLPAGTAVKSAGDSRRLAGGMDGAGGAMIVQLHVDGHVIAQAMVDPQRKFVQQNFGGNVQKAYGVGA